MTDFYQTSLLELRTTETYLRFLIDDVLNGLNQDEESAVIEHIETRIKSPESAKNKLRRLGYEENEEEALKHLHDIVGIRLVVHFLGDIETVRQCIIDSGKFNILQEKDYVKNSKPGGYRGYHIIIQTSMNGKVFMSEIQIRTVAMDCWASLEHQIRYKKNLINEELINSELKRCSDEMMSADISMEMIKQIVKDGK